MVSSVQITIKCHSAIAIVLGQLSCVRGPDFMLVQFQERTREPAVRTGIVASDSRPQEPFVPPIRQRGLYLNKRTDQRPKELSPKGIAYSFQGQLMRHDKDEGEFEGLATL